MTLQSGISYLGSYIAGEKGGPKKRLTIAHYAEQIPHRLLLSRAFSSQCNCQRHTPPRIVQNGKGVGNECVKMWSSMHNERTLLSAPDLRPSIRGPSSIEDQNTSKKEKGKGQRGLVAVVRLKFELPRE